MEVRGIEKNICCILAIIMLFLGMNVDVPTVDSSFLCDSAVVNVTSESIKPLNLGFSQPVACTLNMIKTSSQAIRTVANNTTFRWQNRVYLYAFFVGIYFLYHSVYQSSESKEDGQLFLCRSIIIDYIHQKDSGE